MSNEAVDTGMVTAKHANVQLHHTVLQILLLKKMKETGGTSESIITYTSHTVHPVFSWTDGLVVCNSWLHVALNCWQWMWVIFLNNVQLFLKSLLEMAFLSKSVTKSISSPNSAIVG